MTTATTPVQTVTLTREAAESLTVELREAAGNLAKARTRIASLIKSAKAGNVHAVMGFKSWPEYVADVLGGLKGLSAGDHEWLLHLMAGEGMSSRAVARALGISQSTASRMIKALEAKGDLDADRDIAATDGATRNAARVGRAPRAPRATPTPTPSTGETVTISTANTHDLAGLATRIVEELSNRWAEGDESAQAALADLRDMVAAFDLA